MPTGRRSGLLDPINLTVTDWSEYKGFGNPTRLLTPADVGETLTIDAAAVNFPYNVAWPQLVSVVRNGWPAVWNPIGLVVSVNETTHLNTPLGNIGREAIPNCALTHYAADWVAADPPLLQRIDFTLEAWTPNVVAWREDFWADVAGSVPEPGTLALVASAAVLGTLRRLPQETSRPARRRTLGAHLRGEVSRFGRLRKSDIIVGGRHRDSYAGPSHP